MQPVPPTPISHGRVVIVQNPSATVAYEPNLELVTVMMNQALTNLTGKSTAAKAWRSLISTQDTVGLKVYAAPGPQSGTRPAVVAAVIEGLLSADISPKHIIIWDKYKDDLIRAGYSQLSEKYKVQIEGSVTAGYDEKTFYEASFAGEPMTGDLEFGRTGENVGRKSYVTKLLVNRVTKVINIAPLLNNYRAGVAGNLYSLAMGSVDNTFRFEQSSARLAQAVPEIYALPAVGDRVVLSIVDALMCQYEGERISFLQYSVVLNELRVSTDPVALDVLSLLELDRHHKTLRNLSSTNFMELYQNASLLELGISDPTRIQVERLH